MDFKRLDFRSPDAAEKLDRHIHEAGARLVGELRAHPSKGEAVVALEKLAEISPRCEVLEVMVKSFPDSRRSLTALLGALARQTEWKDFDRLWQLSREFAGLRPDWLAQARALLEEALEQPGPVIGLPLRQPEKPGASGLKNKLSSWFGARPKAGRERSEFQAVYLAPLVTEMENLGRPAPTRPNAPAPVRTRQQRIDDLMAGGDLTDELFLVLSSREDGYDNLKRLVERRSETLASLKRPRFGLEPSGEQALEIWELLPESARSGFGPWLVEAAANQLSEEELLGFAGAASSEVVEAALSVLLKRFTETPLRADRQVAQRLLAAQPALRPLIREFFVAAVPPGREEFPVYSYSEPGSGRAGLAVGGEQLIFSCPGCVVGFTAAGAGLFIHRGDDLPVVQFVVDLGVYVGQRPDAICLLRVDPEDYYILPFRSDFRLQPGDELSSKGRQYQISRSSGNLVLDTATATVSRGEITPDRWFNEGAAALASDWPEFRQEIHEAGDGVRVFLHRATRQFHAWVGPPGPSTLFACQVGERLFGLEVHEAGHSMHCWMCR